MLKNHYKTIQVVKLLSNIDTPQIFVKKKLQDFEKFKLTLVFHLLSFVSYLPQIVIFFSSGHVQESFFTFVWGRESWSEINTLLREPPRQSCYNPAWMGRWGENGIFIPDHELNSSSYYTFTKTILDLPYGIFQTHIGIIGKKLRFL
jgi:hypothetical protein